MNNQRCWGNKARNVKAATIATSVPSIRMAALLNDAPNTYPDWWKLSQNRPSMASPSPSTRLSRSRLPWPGQSWSLLWPGLIGSLLRVSGSKVQKLDIEKRKTHHSPKANKHLFESDGSNFQRSTFNVLALSDSIFQTAGCINSTVEFWCSGFRVRHSMLDVSFYVHLNLWLRNRSISHFNPILLADDT